MNLHDSLQLFSIAQSSLHDPLLVQFARRRRVARGHRVGHARSCRGRCAISGDLGRVPRGRREVDDGRGVNVPIALRERADVGCSISMKSRSPARLSHLRLSQTL